ncbi:hypothetical protein [Microbispora sp. NPDC049125]|uniref:hypothetical protein n=1 Tax=Microbispora sp. NPDC049125 TaxID=3154929 RepID=UPI0034665E75
MDERFKAACERLFTIYPEQTGANCGFWLRAFCFESGRAFRVDRDPMEGFRIFASERDGVDRPPFTEAQIKAGEFTAELTPELLDDLERAFPVPEDWRMYGYYEDGELNALVYMQPYGDQLIGVHWLSRIGCRAPEDITLGRFFNVGLFWSMFTDGALREVGRYLAKQDRPVLFGAAEPDIEFMAVPDGDGHTFFARSISGFDRHSFTINDAEQLIKASPQIDLRERLAGPR